MYPLNDRKILSLIACQSHTAAVNMCVCVCLQMQTNLSLSPVVVAAEPLVRGLRKLPEDIDWSYSGLYESGFYFFVCVCKVEGKRCMKVTGVFLTGSGIFGCASAESL